MAIKNTALGGTDWANDEEVDATDLNDTFDAALSKIQTLSAFWLNSDLYDVYDDFDSYSTGTFSTNSKWDISNSTTGTATATTTIEASTFAGGSNQEMKMFSSSNNAFSSGGSNLAKSIDLTADTHKFFRVFCSYSGSGSDQPGTAYLRISFDGGSTYHNIFTYNLNDDSGLGVTSSVLVVAKGSDEYDCYIGGKMVQNLTDASFEIWINSSCGTSGIQTRSLSTYIDDVRESKGIIS